MENIPKFMIKALDTDLDLPCVSTFRYELFRIEICELETPPFQPIASVPTTSQKSAKKNPSIFFYKNLPRGPN